MSYSDQHKKAMAFIYQNVGHLEGVEFETDELINFIVNVFSEGHTERALIAFEKGKELYGTLVWNEAAERVRKEM